MTKKVSEKKTQLEQLADRIERLRLASYLEMANKPSRIIWTNLLAGTFRGIGFTVGAVIVIAIVAKILSVLISMNIPYLSEQLASFLDLINDYSIKK